MKTKTLIASLGFSLMGVLALFAVGFIIHPAEQAKADIGGNINYLSGRWVYGTTTVTNAGGVLVLATSTGREYARIDNIGSNPAYLYFTNGATSSIPDYANLTTTGTTSTATSCGATACTTTGISVNGGMFLNASSTYEIKLDNLYLGAVFAIGQATTVLSVSANQ